MAIRDDRGKLSAGLSLAAMALDLTRAGDEAEQSEVVSVLTFEIGGEEFAVGVELTEGVVGCPKISPLPSPPDGFSGIVSVRGRMTLVMDLGLGGLQKTDRRRLILLKGEAQIGLMADRVEGITALSPQDVRKLSEKMEDHRFRRKSNPVSRWPASSYYKKQGRRVPILDLERLVRI